jgi:hypothetical protein
MVITNSTIARNLGAGFGGIGVPPSGGLVNSGGTVILHNTILALNSGGFSLVPVPDCAGVVTSRGHNLIGDPTGCTITLRPSDLTGDPGLDTFTADGAPGQGHFPLLPTSQAIDAGDDAACPRWDQLGQRRVNIPHVGTSRCDIGAIEFPGQDDRWHDEDVAALTPASP